MSNEIKRNIFSRIQMILKVNWLLYFYKQCGMYSWSILLWLVCLQSRSIFPLICLYIFLQKKITSLLFFVDEHWKPRSNTTRFGNYRFRVISVILWKQYSRRKFVGFFLMISGRLLPESTRNWQESTGKNPDNFRSKYCFHVPAISCRIR